MEVQISFASVAVPPQPHGIPWHRPRRSQAEVVAKVSTPKDAAFCPSTGREERPGVGYLQGSHRTRPAHGQPATSRTDTRVLQGAHPADCRARAESETGPPESLGFLLGFRKLGASQNKVRCPCPPSVLRRAAARSAVRRRGSFRTTWLRSKRVF